MDTNCAGFWLLLCNEEETALEEAEIRHAAAALAIISLGSEEAQELRRERRRATRQYLTRPELLSNPRIATPWQKLFESQSDRAFITTMGFDVNAFSYILKSGFADRWYRTPIPRTDTPATAVARPYRGSLDAAGALGLALHYLSSTMREVSLQEIFALIPSTVSRYIIFALKILHDTLRDIPETRIAWPEGDEFEALSILIQQRHPLLIGAFADIDGLNVPAQTSANEEIENATYNGWLSEHFISCVIVFSPEGKFLKLSNKFNELFLTDSKRCYHCCSCKRAR